MSRGKNRQQWHCRACEKRAYGSQGRAQQAIDNLAENSRRGRTPKRAYPCPYGNGWHMTSQEERIAG